MRRAGVRPALTLERTPRAGGPERVSRRVSQDGAPSPRGLSLWPGWSLERGRRMEQLAVRTGRVTSRTPSRCNATRPVERTPRNDGRLVALSARHRINRHGQQASRESQPQAAHGGVSPAPAVRPGSGRSRPASSAKFWERPLERLAQWPVGTWLMHTAATRGYRFESLCARSGTSARARRARRARRPRPQQRSYAESPSGRSRKSGPAKSTLLLPGARDGFTSVEAQVRAAYRMPSP